MSVHKAISAHVNKQNQMITSFLELDQKREDYIEEAISKCKQGQPFSTDKINEVTTRMNEISKQGVVPARKYVTAEMVEEYVHNIL
ncbi:YpbS family protein [Cytobacillus sp. FJAT-53684]|uniref:YpbS family protein n=1 Tax=Cytobacillus mangrovibacter TaxID=3299024 RepID=A0ABW6JTU8_9BACI